MEIVYFSKYPPTTWNPIKNKRRSLMQRLSSWFEDHLPLRRRSSDVRHQNNNNINRSERSSRRKASKSVAAPRMRYSISNAQKQSSNNNSFNNNDSIEKMSFSSSAAAPNAMSASMIGKDSIYDDGYTDHNHYRPAYHDDMSMSTISHLLIPPPPQSFNDAPLSQSFSSSTYSATSSCRRPRIRTNPWISSSTHHRSASSQNSMFRSPQPSSTLASRSVYSAPDALSSSAGGGGKGQQQQQKKQSLKPPELLYSSMDRTSQLRVKSLDESTCSSGYGSQDSSPESSVHSPDWQQQLTTLQQQQQQSQKRVVVEESVEGNAAMRYRPSVMTKSHPARGSGGFHDDEHVYHELESLHRLSLLLEERASSSESGEFLSPQPTQEEKPSFDNGDSRASSPIYAIPYDSQRNSLCSENPLLPEFSKALFHHGAYESPYARIQPLSIESPFFQKTPPRTSSYAVPCQKRLAPQWNPPPPPPIDSSNSGENEVEEVDFLAELDKQIAELQLQSDAVRQLVEAAKERQELRERTRLLCMEHINELRKMRWFMRNNFELCL